MQAIHSFRVEAGQSEDPKGILARDPHFPKKAAYTSCVSYEGKTPFQVEKHLWRLDQSARELGFSVEIPLLKTRLVIEHLLRESKDDSRFLRLTVTPNNLVIISRPLVIDEKVYEGVSASTVSLERPLVSAKTIPSEEMAAAYQAAAEKGHHDVLLVNAAGNITEGSRSNVMWVKGETLYWCSQALAGITQAEVLDIATGLLKSGEITRIEMTPEGLPLDQLSEIDELFITQTSRGIVPVLQVNDVVIGKGTIGPKTKALRSGYRKRIRDFVA